MIPIRRAPRTCCPPTTPRAPRHSAINLRIAAVRRFATSFPIVVDPKAIALKFKDKMNVNRWSLETPFEPEDKMQIANEILENNPRTSLSELFAKKNWSIESFNTPHVPTILGALTQKEAFSKRTGDRYHLFMDMPIKLVGKGWMIPLELEQFREPIERSARFERLINPNYAFYNVYLTIDQRPVAPGTSQRRTGWHADSYVNVETRVEAIQNKPNIETDSIYLASDCIPTEFCPGPFPFDSLDPNDTESVLKHFEKYAKGNQIVTHNPHTLVRMGPECVHQVGLNKTNHIMQRTFFKITFSRQILNREGNGLNPLFDVNWPMFPRRADTRNHSNVISGYYAKADAYRLLETPELAKMFQNACQFALKSNSIKAYLATPGELLKTAVDGFTTTVNSAKAGDWKITTQSGSQYFLSTEKLEQLYRAHNDGIFKPKQKRSLCLELKEHIKIMAPWGSLQYLREGDYLVQKDGEIYGILKKDFQDNYTTLDLAKV